MVEKVDIPIADSERIISPGSVILVSTGLDDIHTISTIAWHMPVSSWPKLVAISLANTRYSLQLIVESQEFCINLPDYSLLDRVVFCGTYSGKEVDKFSEAGFTPMRCRSISSSYIQECIAHIECTLFSIFEAGDHKIVVGEVKSAYANENLFNSDGVIDISRVALIHHLGGSHFCMLKKES
jgi:flavin reductase (DIM6/NTAB) family NADH-FMN oxidoreductase RutF